MRLFSSEVLFVVRVLVVRAPHFPCLSHAPHAHGPTANGTRMLGTCLCLSCPLCRIPSCRKLCIKIHQLRLPEKALLCGSQKRRFYVTPTTSMMKACCAYFGTRAQARIHHKRAMTCASMLMLCINLCFPLHKHDMRLPCTRLAGATLALHGRPSLIQRHLLP